MSQWGTNILRECAPGGRAGIRRVFAATYIGRRVAAGRRNPLYDHAIWNVESRTTPGSLRANNGVESFRDAFLRGVAQEDHSAAYRFVQSLQLQQNISRGATRAARCSATTDRPRGRRDRALSLERSRKEARGSERALIEPHHPVSGASMNRPLPQRRISELHVRDEPGPFGAHITAVCSRDLASLVFVICYAFRI